MRSECTALLIALAASPAMGEDDTLSWLMQAHATTAPATQPATAQAVNPLKRPTGQQGIPGAIRLSSGEELTGEISTTPGKPLRVWVEDEHRYVDLALDEIREIRAVVLWQRLEREWHFIASGSDVKEYTGKTYPARETAHTFTTHDGRSINGTIVAPLYISAGGERRTLVLNKRSKGSIGQSLEQLVYIEQVTLNGRNTP